MDEIITLDYGSGGKKTSRLIESMIVPALANPALSELGDGAVIPGADKLVFSTDSFVVDPIFFPGGSIGKLSVCGTVNDIAMCGGEPKYLSCAFIIEEGFPAAELERVVEAIREAGEKAGVQVVTGDTKVVERGRGDKIYINTAGIGFLKYPGLSPKAIRAGDKVIVSGTVGDHGTAVMLARSGMMQGNIKSDCAPLNGLCAAILRGDDVGAIAARFMNTLIDMATRQCGAARSETGLDSVVLSGGTFQNMYLMRRLPERLREAGFTVYHHSRVSTNDEGISLGQLMVAQHQLERK